MKYCRNCGAEVADEAVICVKCGCSLTGETPLKAVNGNISDKDWWATFLFCWFLGFLGIHRFYVGRTGSAIAMIFTMGGLGIWVLVDWIVILCGNFKDKDGKLIQRK